MHNLEDLIGGHIMGAGPLRRLEKGPNLFVGCLPFIYIYIYLILNYSLSLSTYIYIYIAIHMCVYIRGLGKRWLERGQGFGTNDHGFAYHLSKGYSVAKKCHAAKFRVRYPLVMSK